MTDDLGFRLRSLREVVPLSARALDKLAGLASGHTSLIESGGKADPQSSTVAKLATVLGCSLDWLVKGEGAAPDPDHVRACVSRRGISSHTASDFAPADPSEAA